MYDRRDIAVGIYDKAIEVKAYHNRNFNLIECREIRLLFNSGWSCLEIASKFNCPQFSVVKELI